MVMAAKIHQYALLGPQIQNVVLRFNVCSEDEAPSIFYLFCESKKVKPKHRGQACIDTHSLVSLRGFPQALTSLGYELSSVIWYQMRIGWFVIQIAYTSVNYQRKRQQFFGEYMIQPTITELCASLWQVRGFINPFYETDDYFEGMHSICLNMTDRYILPTGKIPRHFMRITDNKIHAAYS